MFFLTFDLKIVQFPIQYSNEPTEIVVGMIRIDDVDSKLVIADRSSNQLCFLISPITETYYKYLAPYSQTHIVQFYFIFHQLFSKQVRNSFEADKWPTSSYVVFYNKMYMSSFLTLCALVTKYHFCLSTHSNRIAECIHVLYT